MLSHYLIIAQRQLRRSPLVALLNVGTLSLGFAGFIAAYAIVGFWQRAEQHFPNADRTLVVTSDWKVIDVVQGTEFASGTVPRTTPWLASYLRTDFPELEAVARLVSLDIIAPVRAGDHTLRLRSFAADAEFLEIFDLPFVAGDPRKALQAPRSVVLTREAAQSLYGDESALGQPIVIGNRYEGTVTGVIGEIPEPSHMGRSAAAPVRFDALVSRDFLEDARPPADDWLLQSDITYVLLPANGSLTAEKLRNQLPEFTALHVPAEQLELAQIRFGVVPVTSLLGMSVDEALFREETGVSISAALLALGSVVLTVACVNFANLATARAAFRSREVGLRKAIGAQARHVIAQHLLEAGLASAAGLGVALALIVLLAPAIERATGIDLGLALFAGIDSWAFLALTLIVVSVAAGAYPAFVLTRVSPLAVLRSGQARTGPRKLATLLLAGRTFDPARTEDVSPFAPQVRTQHGVISRALAEEFGFAMPAEAVGEMIYIPSIGAPRPFRIIGVVEDKPLLIASGYGPRPSAYLFNPDLRFHVVRLPADDVAAGLAAVDALWARLAPDVAIQRRFADDYFNDVYSIFARVSDAFAVLTGIALLISAMGLFAIATLVANRRVHEIGVRKTLGARTADIVQMLLRAFAKPVLVANVVAWPLAFFSTRAYLDVFIDPVDLTFAPFALCLMATAAVAWIAVSGQTLRAARMTPARVLRQE